MTEVLITDREDLRPGDVLRVWPQAIPEQWAEGPIYEMSGGRLMVAGVSLRWGHGEWATDRFDLTAHPARRTVPDLPTERGSVILVTAINGERLDRPAPSLAPAIGGAWFVYGRGWHFPDDITAWIPATVTETGPEVTRWATST